MKLLIYKVYIIIHLINNGVIMLNKLFDASIKIYSIYNYDLSHSKIIQCYNDK